MRLLYPDQPARECGMSMKGLCRAERWDDWRVLDSWLSMSKGRVRALTVLARRRSPKCVCPDTRRRHSFFRSPQSVPDAVKTLLWEEGRVS